MRQRVWALLPLAAAMVVVPLSYQLFSGHPVPISGMVKSSFPHITWHGSYFTETLNIAQMEGWNSVVWTLNPVVVSGLLIVGMTFIAVAMDGKSSRGSVLMIGVVGILLLANLLLFQKWQKSVDPRYFALPMTAAVFVVATGLSAVAEKVTWTSRSVTSALPLLAALIAFTSNAWLATERAPGRWNQNSDWTTQVYKDVSKVLPPDAVVAGTDVGALAFWTSRKVINLDGVMNDYDYQEQLRDGRLKDYLRRHGVTHVGTALWEAEPTYTGRTVEPMYRHQIDVEAAKGGHYECHPFYVYSYVFAKFSDSLCLKQSAEIFRVSAGRQAVGEVAYVVYELPREQSAFPGRDLPISEGDKGGE